VFHPTAKGKITFAFYSDFVKRFQKNIDQINLFKLIRESLVSLSSIASLMQLPKSWSSWPDVRKTPQTMKLRP
jgi:hypothetical protein